MIVNAFADLLRRRDPPRGFAAAGRRVTSSDSRAQADRLGAIDIVRGLAMIFMLLNHATWHVPGISFRVNFGWDVPLPPLPIINPYMWVGLLQGTPLFFIMAGFSVALFELSCRRKGWTEAQITRFLLVRGAALIALDWLLLPWQFYPDAGYIPQVYYVLTTIGICLWLMAFLRRLPAWALLLLAVALTLAVQAAYKMVILPLPVDMVRTLFLYMSPLDPIKFGFPVLPWLGMIAMGYLTMRYVDARPAHFGPLTLLVALLSWIAWFIIADSNGFGSLFPLHPLLMTKHPPALDYLMFYTGLTYTLLYVMHRLQPFQHRFPLKRVALLGQTALIFYLLHFYVIDVMTILVLPFNLYPLVSALLVAALSLPVLYLLCTRYRAYRKAHPESVLKYL